MFASKLSGPLDTFITAGRHPKHLTLPTSIVVSPDGNFVYVTDFPTHSILQFNRDQQSGQLSARGFVQDEIKDGRFVIADRGLTMPKCMAIPPDGKSLYLCSVLGTLSTWTRNAETGALEFVELHKEGQNGVKGLSYAIEVSAVPKTNRICVVGQKANGFAQFERGSDGRLKYLTSHTSVVDEKHTLALPTSLAVSSDLRFFYVASAKRTLSMLGIVNDPFIDRIDEPK